MGLQTGTLLFQALARLATENADFAAHLQLSYAGKDSALWQQWMEQHHLIFLRIMVWCREKMPCTCKTRHPSISYSPGASLNRKGSFRKIYEYLASAKPILLLIDGETDSEMEEWFAELACGKVCYQQEAQLEELKGFLLQIFVQWTATRLSTPFISSETIQAMSWEKQLEKLWSE